MRLYTISVLNIRNVSIRTNCAYSIEPHKRIKTAEAIRTLGKKASFLSQMEIPMNSFFRRFDSWSGPDDSKYSRQAYKNGLSCWNGPERSTEVRSAGHWHLSKAFSSSLLSFSGPTVMRFREQANRCERTRPLRVSIRVHDSRRLYGTANP